MGDHPFPVAAEFFPLRSRSVRLMPQRWVVRHRGSEPRFVVFEPVPSHTRLLPLDQVDDSVEHL